MDGEQGSGRESQWGIRAMRDSFEKIKKYLREVWSELTRVSWPQRKEIIASTMVVILCTLIVAFFLGIVDVALQKLLGYLIK